jgi:3-methyladenine DNA glycosylase AlkD
MKEATRQFLIENSETQYKEFSASLIPGVDNILGVRLPILRKKAKELARGDWKQELETEDIYYEEIMLRGMTISYVKGSIGEMLPYIAAFIPKVDNWSVCDSVFSKMDVLRTDKEKTWAFIRPYLYSDKEFEVRSAVIIMMQHLLKSDREGKTIKRLRTITEEDCILQRQPLEPNSILQCQPLERDSILQRQPLEPNSILQRQPLERDSISQRQPLEPNSILQRQSLEPNSILQRQLPPENPWLSKVLDALNRAFPQYYASMAVAWTLAEGFCCYPAEVFAFLKDNELDDATYNRALQKITESLIPQAEVKKLIKGMKNRMK